jgi:predicted phosphodiesterase
MEMRILSRSLCLIADVHGNASALEAVLKDAAKAGCTDYLSVGDIVKRGPRPQECVDLLRQVKTKSWVMGNHEKTYHDMLADHDPHTQGAKRIMEIILNAYDYFYLNDLTYQWLANLPYLQLCQFEGLKIAIMHSLPNKPWGNETNPRSDQENFDQMLKKSAADLAVYGHTHKQLMRYSTQDRLVINPGSVGMPTTSGTWQHNNLAQYAILRLAGSDVLGVEFRRVTYDIQPEIMAAHERNLPYGDLYCGLLRTGEYTYSVEQIEEYNQRHQYDSITNFKEYFAWKK